MGFVDALAKLGSTLPSIPRPERRPELPKRFLYTGIALALYILMTSVPLYGIETAGGFQAPEIMAVVFAMQQGTLAQLGIGPIVTAGLILQILVGAELIKLDLTDPEDRRKFTLAEKGLAFIIAAVEAGGYTLNCSIFWTPIPGGNPIFQCTAPFYIRAFVWLQLVIATIFILLLDELLGRGWGIGSGISLFILGGVAKRIFIDLFSPLSVGENGEPMGFIPYIIHSAITGKLDLWSIILRYDPEVRTLLPSLIGFVGTFILIAIIVYLQSMRINIPITSQRAPGIRTRIPLQFLYVSNIPVLLASILFSNILLFEQLTRGIGPLNAFLRTLSYYTAAPNFITVIYDPIRAAVYSALLIGLSLAFGFMWVELAGLSPSAQADNLIKSGLEIPGMRRNPRILEGLLAKYIYPLTFISSIIVALVAIAGSILNVYGGGIGILLATGIIANFYGIIAYERALEAYPLLKKIIGEE